MAGNFRCATKIFFFFKKKGGIIDGGKIFGKKKISSLSLEFITGNGRVAGDNEGNIIKP